MDTVKSSPAKLKNIRQGFRFLDLFYTRVFAVFFFIAFLLVIIERLIFSIDDPSKHVVYFMLPATITITAVWVVLSMKSELSIFTKPLTLSAKRKALVARGIAIFIAYQGIELANDILAENKLVYFWIITKPFLVLGILILIVSFIRLSFRKRTTKAYKGRETYQKAKNKSRKREEEKIKEAGIQGEKDVAYALSWLDEGYEVYQNVYLEHEGQVQEFDHIVIGKQGIFNIETKNLVGDIVIDQEGNWIREKHGHREGMKNPLFQAQRHHKILKGILKDQYPIIDVIVLANEKTIVTGSKNSPLHIVKVDMLQYFIEAYQHEKFISMEDVKRISGILEGHIAHKNKS